MKLSGMEVRRKKDMSPETVRASKRVESSSRQVELRNFFVHRAYYRFLRISRVSPECQNRSTKAGNKVGHPSKDKKLHTIHL